MYLCQFSQNSSSGSKDIASERSYADADADEDADGIHTKNNMSPTFGKLGQGHQNLINSQPPPNNASVQVWSKSINWFKDNCVGKTNFNSFYGLVTLKIRSRSP